MLHWNPIGCLRFITVLYSSRVASRWWWLLPVCRTQSCNQMKLKLGSSGYHVLPLDVCKFQESWHSPLKFRTLQWTSSCRSFSKFSNLRLLDTFDQIIYLCWSCGITFLWPFIPGIGIEDSQVVLGKCLLVLTQWVCPSLERHHIRSRITVAECFQLHPSCDVVWLYCRKNFHAVDRSCVISSVGVEECHEFNKVTMVGLVSFNKVRHDGLLVVAVQKEQRRKRF